MVWLLCMIRVHVSVVIIFCAGNIMLKKRKINLSGAGVTARNHRPGPHPDWCTIKYRFRLALGVENPFVSTSTIWPRCSSIFGTVFGQCHVEPPRTHFGLCGAKENFKQHNNPKPRQVIVDGQRVLCMTQRYVQLQL